MLPHPWMVSQSRTRSPGREPTNSEWSTDVLFAAHSGLKSDITALPKSANRRHPMDYGPRPNHLFRQSNRAKRGDISLNRHHVAAELNVDPGANCKVWLGHQEARSRAFCLLVLATTLVGEDEISQADIWCAGIELLKNGDSLLGATREAIGIAQEWQIIQRRALRVQLHRPLHLDRRFLRMAGCR